MADQLNNEMPEGFEHPKVIVQDMTPDMIDEVLYNKMPQDSTVVVINSVMAALDETESLQRARKVMAHREAFLKKLYDYKFEKLPLAKMKTLMTYLDKPAYQPKEIEKTKSIGTIYLSEWVRSIVVYNEMEVLKKRKSKTSPKVPIKEKSKEKKKELVSPSMTET